MSSSTSAIRRRSGSTSSSDIHCSIRPRARTPSDRDLRWRERAHAIGFAPQTGTINVTTKTIGTTTVKLVAHLAVAHAAHARAAARRDAGDLLGAIATLAARVYTDALWFGEVGQPSRVLERRCAGSCSPVAVTGLGTDLLRAGEPRARRAPHGLERAVRCTLVAAIACGLLSFELRPGRQLGAARAVGQPRPTSASRDPLFPPRRRLLRVHAAALPAARPLAARGCC